MTGNQTITTQYFGHTAGSQPITTQHHDLPEAGGNSTHDGRNEMVEVTVAGTLQLEGVVANVVEGLVVNNVALISVLNLVRG